MTKFARLALLGLLFATSVYPEVTPVVDGSDSPSVVREIARHRRHHRRSHRRHACYRRHRHFHGRR